MVVVSLSLISFFIILISFLILMFFINFTRKYFSDMTFYDHLQTLNQIDEKGNLIYPKEQMGGYHISIIYHINGMDPDEVTEFQDFYSNLTKNPKFKDKLFEILIVVHSPDGRYLRSLFNLIQQNYSTLRYVQSRDNEILDFISASAQARGGIISKAEYCTKISTAILRLKDKPVVILAESDLQDQLPGLQSNDFGKIAMCSKIGFITAFSRLHSIGYGSLYELKMLCDHYHVTIQYFKTGDIIEVGMFDYIQLVFCDMYVDLLYFFGFYKKEKSQKK